jgi:hypothetical protein
MEIRAELNAHLKANAAISSLVGSQIYPHIGYKDQALPVVTYIVKDNPTSDLDGNSSETTFDVSISCFAEDYADAHSIASAVKSAMDVIDGNIGAQAINSIEVVDETEDYNPDEDFFYVTVNFTIYP